jgi:hypothetical protein
MFCAKSMDRKARKGKDCHFEPFDKAQDKLREKSFLDPAHALGMTGSGLSLGVLARWREEISNLKRCRLLKNLRRPRKFSIIETQSFNLKAAKQIGLTISPNVLAQADRVVK